MRLIDVDALLKDNVEKLAYDPVKYTYEYGFVVMVEDILKAPTVDVAEVPRWIPVTERLPEEGQRVLVTYDLVNGYPWVNILRYGKPIFEDKPCFYEADSEWGDVPYDGIVAWMPLPEPYREETEDEET